ncbi:hypothetical protein FNV43_RR08534 [Rhamnella rubrinervis]|uniref:Uncharacterized protein n=1 Tax=Rhamnella rubrinervis TaxID=2594499 RepID=A0A8K0H928_9ROSA|nr:hypothetical protein FNV43_RR08534 [Rhamnella rubrinervis]
MAESVVTFLLQKLDTFAHENVKLLGGMREDVGYVRDELERIRAFLRVADAKEEGDEEIKVWVKQVRHVAYDMEDVLDEFHLRFSHHGGRGFYRHLRKIALTIKNLKARYRMASGSMEEGSSSSSVAVNKTWYDLRGDALLLEEAQLVGIDKPKRDLIGGLVGGRSELQVVAVAGMGGLGKTTLARKVYEDDVEADSMDSGELKAILAGFLREKRYLVMLDDVWEVGAWDALKYVFPTNNNGCRLMLTTRNTKVASVSTIDFGGMVYDLKPLSPEQSWNLFCGKAFQGNQCPPYLEKLSEKILRKCEGLPLAIVAISEYEKILSLSFNDLPYNLKYCFLFLSIFPEDYLIDPRKLIRFWIVEGFVQEKEGRIPEEVGQGYFNELVNRSLIQVVGRNYDGRITECRIHDLLREIILLKSKDQSFVAIFGEQSKALPERARRLSIHKPLEIVDGEYDFSSLRSLFWFGAKDDSIPSFSLSTFFNGGLRFLKVLDCTGANIDTFPEEIAKLYNLRYLSLRDTKVRSIARSIGKLRNLETLDLRDTYVTELPNEILRLRRLRHILVYRRSEKRFSSSAEVIGFKALGSLETLSFLQSLCYIEVNHGGAGVMKSIGELTQLRRLCIVQIRAEHGADLCSSIEKLRYLRSLSLLSANPDEVLNLQNISSPPSCLQRLSISGRLQILPNWIPSLSNLTTLVLEVSGLQIDPFESLQSLPNLVYVELIQAYDGETLCFKAGDFKMLKLLAFSKLDRLRKVTIEKGTMPLEGIRFISCKSLEEVPSGIETLGNLESLELIDMPDEFLSQLRQRRNDLLHISSILIGHEADGVVDRYVL